MHPGFALPLSVEQFRFALRAGLGRAYMHVRDHGADGVLDEIRAACRRNLAHDPQIEDGRAEWMMRIVDLTTASDTIREDVLAALPEAEFWDAQHLCDLPAKFARRGSERARSALYAQFDSGRYKEWWIGGEQLIELDNIEGLLHVVGRLGARMRASDPGDAFDADVIERASEILSEETVEAAVFEAAKSDPDVAAYVDAYEQEKRAAGARRTGPQASPAAPPTFSEVKRRIESADAGSFGPYWFDVWGRAASGADLQKALDGLIVETDSARLRRYLSIFKRRPMPRFEPRLLELTGHHDDRVRRWAAAALSHVQHAEVREAAIAWIRAGLWRRSPLCLLASNLRESDADLIEEALRSPPEPGLLHDAVADLLDVYEKHAYPAAAGPVLWAYENSPCSTCRGRAVGWLLDQGVAPGWLLEECWHDSNADIRERVVSRAA